MTRYRILQKVVELGSFTKAAEQLGYTQSSVSQMVASLEKEMGIKLLTRSRSGTELTIEGKEIYPYVERIINQHRIMQEKISEIKGIESGVVRIGTIASITYQWMPELVKGFQKIYPNVQFLFQQGDYSSIQEWIKNGTVDFGFVTAPAVTDLKTRALTRGEMLLILPLSHPMARKPSVRLEEICQEPFILLEEGNYNEAMLAFDKANLRPNLKFTIHDDFTIMRMVENGMGISILSELILRDTNYQIVSIPLDPPVYRDLSIGYRGDDSIPIASKRFISYLYDHISGL